jgi:uncharacterized Tic20 family protein
MSDLPSRSAPPGDDRYRWETQPPAPRPDGGVVSVVAWLAWALVLVLFWPAAPFFWTIAAALWFSTRDRPKSFVHCSTTEALNTQLSGLCIGTVTLAVAGGAGLAALNGDGAPRTFGTVVAVLAGLLFVASTVAHMGACVIGAARVSSGEVPVFRWTLPLLSQHRAARGPVGSR